MSAAPPPDLLVPETIILVERWLEAAGGHETRDERRTQQRLHRLLDDPDGTAFAMAFVDRVIRPESPTVAAHQFATVVAEHSLPGFLSRVDRLLLRAGAALAPVLPRVVMPLAIRRMRQLVGHLVVDARPRPMARHLGSRREEGFALNVNLLGEAVLGQAEADRRLDRTIDLLQQRDITYVSVKASSIVAQLPHWDHERAVDLVAGRFRTLLRVAATTDPPTFVNLDMEEYRDLHITLDAFTSVLDEHEFHTATAGIVLQAYLPDAFDALQDLVGWANRRHGRTVEGQAGGTVKIRLVKGANLAMEQVEAEIRGWPQAPYPTKAEVDANYKRCVDWAVHPDHLRGVRVGIASHNLFDVAWASLVADRRGVGESLDFEMLEGMADALARTVRDEQADLLLYTPVVRPRDFDVAISYLFRRLEENATDENFIRHLFDLRPGSPAFETEAERFAAAVADRWSVPVRPRRTQNRLESLSTSASPDAFTNEPDTDPVLAPNRDWAAAIVARRPRSPKEPLLTTTDAVDQKIEFAARGAATWSVRPAAERRGLLHAVADELGARRGDLVAAMVDEGRKTVAQADPEVSEAIDFARFYAAHSTVTDGSAGARFTPFGVVVVVPPWNFPVAIPAGGVMAALAAGNAVVLKPAPETPRCAEIVAECCWAAGVPREAVQFVRTPDDDVGRHLITHSGVGAVVLTGAWETARMFHRWRPDLSLLAETSGKNAIVITPNADIDLAVSDLVASAFGHSGQKCSAASLAICVGDVARSERFRRQLLDATMTLAIGSPKRLATTMGPTIVEPTEKLFRGLTELDPGEQWLLEPRRRDDGIWTPGIRTGVRDGSWFHRTECFGPVLGIMEAATLDDAIRIQNGTEFGLTGGIHSLDVNEIETWLERVRVGNAYVNRGITGAIVRRQPFGGWKRSSVGPGAKAGGPNYVAQFGRWDPTDRDLPDREWLDAADAADAAAWDVEFGIEHDPTGLTYESNVFRYRSLRGVLVRVGPDADEREVRRSVSGARRTGTPVTVSRAGDETVETLIARLPLLDVERIRALGAIEPELRSAAFDAGLHYADAPVLTDGRRELLHYLHEQAVSRTTHRYGNLID